MLKISRTDEFFPKPNVVLCNENYYITKGGRIGIPAMRIHETYPLELKCEYMVPKIKIQPSSFP